MALFLRKPKQQPENLLVARTDRIGDFVLTLPVFESLSQHSLHFSVLCRRAVVPLLDHNPHVHRIITADDPVDGVIDTIMNAGFDALLVLVNDSLIRQLLPRLRGIPVRIGPMSKPFAWREYTHPVLQKRSRSRLNEAEYNLELLRIFGIDTAPAIRPKLYLTGDERSAFAKVLTQHLNGKAWPKPRVILHQGMGGSALNWPSSHYQNLAQRMLEAGMGVILTGFGPAEVEQNQMLFNRFRGCFDDCLIDLSDRLSLRELALLIDTADLFVGPSTGPTHIANAVGTPIISFYPPIQVQSATRWQPYLADALIFTPEVTCGKKYHCSRDRCRFFDCMATITPEAVFAQLTRLLDRTA
jgi:ADP-heptose:LPS heptosyltransferase